MWSSNSSDQHGQKIIISINPNEDEFELTVEAQAASFRARGSAFFSRERLMACVAAIEGYPIKACDPVKLESGYYGVDGKLVEKHVAISVSTLGNTGALLMSVDLFSPALESWRSGLGAGGRCDFRVSYEGLSEFKDKLKSILDGETRVLFENFEPREG